jgi:hypothetical protein
MSNKVKHLLTALLLASTVSLGGCLFGNSVEVRGIVDEQGNAQIVSVNANGAWLACILDDDVSLFEFDCSFFTETISSFRVSSVELLLFLFLVDPMVIQVPDTVSNLRGSFNHPAVGGDLEIRGPFTSVPVDLGRSLTAESGMSLYVAAIPEQYHSQVADIDGPIRNPKPADPVGFSLTFDAPPGTAEIPMKAIVAAQARMRNGSDFYLPVFPCVAEMGEAPSVSVPVPAPGSSTSVDLPPPSALQGCSGELFNLGSGFRPPQVVEPVPALGPWALTALLGAIAGLGWLSRRRRR